jgi:uncharacterized protein
MSTRITPQLLDVLREEFRLDWYGIHGVSHWARVRHNGLLLAPKTGANIAVVEYFAFLHDVARKDDYEDPGHGARSANFALGLPHEVLPLDDRQLEGLSEACAGHSDGHTEASVTVMTCWDADRLDLGRVGVVPAPQYLCTASAREESVIAAAYRRSLSMTLAK